MTRHALLVACLLGCLLPLGARADEAPTAPQGSVAAARRPLPGIEGGTFRFVVLADTHASTAHAENGAAFAELVEAAEGLRPDLAIFVGDCVDGHVQDAAGLERNWDVFDEIAARLPCPYRLVVGNNDVHDMPSAELWMKRYGVPTCSFRVGNARFVCLNGEQLRSPGRIDETGLRLLAAAVEDAEEGEHLFVFTHRPWWRAPPPQSNWMSAVHPLLAKHPSAHAFAGHWHHYEKGTERDGVRYTIAAAGGGKVGKVEVGGEFHAFLLVTVADEDVKVEVVRDGKALADDVVTEQHCALLRRLEESLDADAVALTGGASAELERELRLENVLEGPLELSLAVTCPDGCNWKVEGPDDVVTVESGAVQTTSYRLTLSGDALPLPEIHATGRSGGEVVLDRKVPWPARFERRLEVRRTEAAPVVDGVLDEAPWATAETAGRFVTLRGDAYAGRATAMRALWTPEHLYVALECAEPALDQLVTKAAQRDWGALADDAVLVFLSVGSGEGEGPYCLGVNAAGVPMEFQVAGGRPDLSWNGPWEVAVKQGEHTWTLEMAIPWSTVAFEPVGEKTFALGVYRHSVPGGRELTGWTPPKGGSLANPEAFGEAVLK